MLVGALFHYQALFVSASYLLLPMLIPGIILGFSSGLKCWRYYPLFWIVVSVVIFLRGIIGRPINSDYLLFILQIVGSPAFYMGLAGFAGAYAAAFIRVGVSSLAGRRVES